MIYQAPGVPTFGALALTLGLRASEGGDVLRMVRALASIVVSYPGGGFSSLLSVDYDPGPGGRPSKTGPRRVSRLELTPGRPFRTKDPELPKDARFVALAPLPRLPAYLPPLVGDRREWWGLSRLYLHMLSELAHQSRDIAAGYGALIPAAALIQWAAELGIRQPPGLLIPSQLERWQRDGNDGEAVFELVGPDRWHLHPRHEAERAMLEEGGRARTARSAAGLEGAKVRAEWLAGGRPPRRGAKR